MKWDAGALSKHRYNSPIYRYLSQKPPRSVCWPKGYKEELGIFLATPGISWAWCLKNFNMTTQRLRRVHHQTKHLHHLGMENVYTATEEDALMYMHNRPRLASVPFWVKPFIIDDFKKGMGWRPTMRKWNIHNHAIVNIVKGNVGNVFHSGGKPRFGRNLDR